MLFWNRQTVKWNSPESMIASQLSKKWPNGGVGDALLAAPSSPSSPSHPPPPPSSYSTVFLLCQVVWAARVELFILPWRAYKTFSINIICSVIFISKNFFFFKFITHQSFRWSESWFAARERAQIVTECCRSSPSKNLDWLRWSHFMSLNWKF